MRVRDRAVIQALIFLTVSGSAQASPLSRCSYRGLRQALAWFKRVAGPETPEFNPSDFWAVTEGTYPNPRAIKRGDDAFVKEFPTSTRRFRDPAGAIAGNAKRIAEILGEPKPGEEDDMKKRALLPARRAFEFVDQQAGLSYLEKARVFDAFARALHFRYIEWNANGPYLLGDGSLSFRGGLGLDIVFRKSDGKMLVGSMPAGDTKPGVVPSYQGFTLLRDFLNRPKPKPPADAQ